MYYYFIKHPDYAIIMFSGSIEGFNDAEFKKPFMELHTLGCFQIVVNFEDVTYISSTIIGSIIEEWRKTTERGGFFAMCQLNPRVLRLFEITNLSSKVKIYSTEQEAVEKCRYESENV